MPPLGYHCQIVGHVFRQLLIVSRPGLGCGRSGLVHRLRPTCFVSVAAVAVNVLIVKNDNDIQLTVGRDAVLEVMQGQGGVHAPLVVHGSAHADLVDCVGGEDVEGPGGLHAPLVRGGILAILVILLTYVVACRLPVVKWGRWRMLSCDSCGQGCMSCCAFPLLIYGG